MNSADPVLLPVLPGTISDHDRCMLIDAGIIVIEHPDPGSLRLIRASAEITSSEILWCAMKALRHHATGDSAIAQRNHFAEMLADLYVNGYPPQHARPKGH